MVTQSVQKQMDQEAKQQNIHSDMEENQDADQKV
jgi:hypothetical protein